MTSEYSSYRKEMISRFAEYGKSFTGYIDPERGAGHVFLAERAESNLFYPELAKFITPNDRHLWFRSMLSSQALAVSVIGTIIERIGLRLLGELQCDDSQPLIADEHKDIRKSGFEFTPKWLELGKRKSQIDVYFESTNWRLAVECKLAEPDIGQCKMSRHGRSQEAYRELAGFEFCSRVKHNGAAYWRYWPCISDTQLPGACSGECPLRRTYQLARNVLCAGIDRETGEYDGRGNALLLYDSRNPSFREGGAGFESYETLRRVLKDASTLRSSSWQKLAGLLEAHGGYDDLLHFLVEKYGIRPKDSK